MNPQLYKANPLGTFGDAGKDSLRGPSYVNVDAAISRNFHVRERLMLTARVDGFNILNHPNLSGPTASISSSNFGRITSAPTDEQRILQGAFKFTF